MKRNLHLSAAQTVALNGIGVFIAASAFLMPVFFYARFQCSDMAVRAMFLLPSILVGLVLCVPARRHLKRGIKNEIWNQQEMDSLRSFAESRSVSVLIWVLFAGFITALLTEHFQGLGWFFFALSQWLTTFRNAMRRQPSNTDHQPIWSNIVPLRSKHWGER
jgi:hypothetical protein